MFSLALAQSSWHRSFNVLSPFILPLHVPKIATPKNAKKHGNFYNGTDTERKISVARSLFYKKRKLFCDPYRTLLA